MKAISHKEAHKLQKAAKAFVLYVPFCGVNDCLRSTIGWIIRAVGLIASGVLKLRLLRFGRNQAQLKQKYGITRETPVTEAIPITASDNSIFAKTRVRLETQRRFFTPGAACVLSS